MTVRNTCPTIAIAVFVSLFGCASYVQAAFHLWQVKEAFSNSDGSVQFIELFDSSANENFLSCCSLTANSDGNVKQFDFPIDLTGNTAGHHLLIATAGFESLSGGVTPTFTFGEGGVTGSFFNPNAANITITFTGNGDSMTFTGATLPKDGIHSLTDAGASTNPAGAPNISSGVNSPTNFAGVAGSVDLSTPAPTGDYNGNHTVDAADYVLWRDTINQTGLVHGSGADGSSDGTINTADFTFWRSKFGNAAGSGVGSAIPEPAACALFLMAVLGLRFGRRGR